MSDNQYVFQVNLKGIIELLSEHIYSNPNVFVRELLQNAVDAITARHSIDEGHKGEVSVYIKEREQITFCDNGIGLTEQEVHKFLAVIGESSKRGSVIEKDLIGRFGIGLLSCLVVSNEIVVKTRSLVGQDNIIWTGKADGTYNIEKTNEEFPVGTQVVLTPKKEWISLFEKEEIKKHLLYYGNALPQPIILQDENGKENLTEKVPAWLHPNDVDKTELMATGRAEFKSNFLDAFPLYSTAGTITGVAYILPNKTQFSSSKNHKVYLKRMFLSDKVTNLLPDWAFFVKCIINSDTLKPTASRESLVENEDLRTTRKELGNCFKDYLKGLAVTDAEKLREIIRIHHTYIKAIASEDKDLLELFIDFLPFETNKGRESFLSIRTYNSVIYYNPSLDDFRQIRRIANSQGLTVINAAYSFEEDIIKKIIIYRPDLDIRLITPHEVLNNFTNVLQDTDDETISGFEKAVNKILKPYYCKVQLKHFTPPDTPAIYIATDQALANKNIQHLGNSNNPFASTLGAFVKNKEEQMPTLCLNMDNELVHKLIMLTGNDVFEPIVNILYIQALMLGQYPVNKKEMDIFNESIYQLLILGMNDFGSFINIGK